MRISDWSSDVCSSDLRLRVNVEEALMALGQGILDANPAIRERLDSNQLTMPHLFEQMLRVVYRLIFLGVAEDRDLLHPPATPKAVRDLYRSEEHTSELQSLMRISYAVFC